MIQHLKDLLDIKNNACTLNSFSEEDIIISLFTQNNTDIAVLQW